MGVEGQWSGGTGGVEGKVTVKWQWIKRQRNVGVDCVFTEAARIVEPEGK